MQTAVRLLLQGCLAQQQVGQLMRCTYGTGLDPAWEVICSYDSAKVGTGRWNNGCLCMQANSANCNSLTLCVTVGPGVGQRLSVGCAMHAFTSRKTLILHGCMAEP